MGRREWVGRTYNFVPLVVGGRTLDWPTRINTRNQKGKIDEYTMKRNMRNTVKCYAPSCDISTKIAYGFRWRFPQEVRNGRSRMLLHV